VDSQGTPLREDSQVTPLKEDKQATPLKEVSQVTPHREGLAVIHLLVPLLNQVHVHPNSVATHLKQDIHLREAIHHRGHKGDVIRHKEDFHSLVVKVATPSPEEDTRSSPGERTLRLEDVLVGNHIQQQARGCSI